MEGAMRVLTVNEAEQVGGGVVIALPAVKLVVGAAIAGGLIVAKHLRDLHLIKTGAELCREGMDVTIKTKDASLTCKSNSKQGPSESLPGAQPNHGGGLWLPSPWRNPRDRMDGTT
jgi:hypothetical protein